MRYACLLVLVLAGCPADDSDEYPVRPGGGGGGGGGGNRPDAAPPTVDAGPALSGRVCLVSDPRDWDSDCAGTAAMGLMVTIGAQTVMTTAGGNFTFAMPPTGTQIVVEGTGVTSIRKFTTGGLSLDTVAITSADWTTWQTQTAFGITDGNGALVLELRDDGVAAAGITADSTPLPGPLASDVVYYSDAAGAFLWDTGMTDADAKALFADMLIGNVSVTATIGTRMGTDTFPVVEGAITFGELDVPSP